MPLLRVEPMRLDRRHDLVAVYAVSRLRHPEHPGMTRREYVLARRTGVRRRLRWLGAGVLAGLAAAGAVLAGVVG